MGADGLLLLAGFQRRTLWSEREGDETLATGTDHVAGAKVNSPEVLAPDAQSLMGLGRLWQLLHVSKRSGSQLSAVRLF
jgi:hypothetical protein